MYRTMLRNGKTVGYYIDDFPDSAAEEEDYISVIVSAEDTYAAYELHRRGFRFMSRSLSLEIPLKNFRSAINPGKKFDMSVLNDWHPEEIYSIAKETFDRDSRFALDIRGEDTDLKNELLHGFIFEQKRQGTMATLLYREGQLVGFNLWSICDGTGRILLGAVSEKYRNTGIAMPLYSCTMNAMKEREADTLRDIVSTSNMASLNLHARIIQCGEGIVRFGHCRDCYKKERSGMDV